MAQVDKIYRHARQGSIQTRRGYLKCIKLFVTWLEKTYNMQNLRNLSNKHLAAFVEHMLEQGNKPSYIIKILSAVRYFHNQLPGPRYALETDNSKLGVPKREPPGDRAWTQSEVEELVSLAVARGQEWIADVLTLQKELGLRVHEAIRLYRVDAERALASGKLRVKGKGGKVRETIELTPAAEATLRRAVRRVKRGARLFVPENLRAHIIIKNVQDFIRENRPQRAGEQLTTHGLRYCYAQGRMDELISQGIPQDQAELRVAREMGHNRQRVTRGYTRQ